MRIRIQLFTLKRNRIQLFILKWIRIPFPKKMQIHADPVKHDDGTCLQGRSRAAGTPTSSGRWKVGVCIRRKFVVFADSPFHRRGGSHDRQPADRRGVQPSARDRSPSERRDAADLYGVGRSYAGTAPASSQAGENEKKRFINYVSKN